MPTAIAHSVSAVAGVGQYCLVRYCHVAALCVLGAWLLTFAAPVAAADPAQIEEGIRIYRGTARCEACHSWMGTGAPPNDIPPIEDGPSLVNSTLDRAQMIEMLSCGVPGGLMPQFAADAWTEQRRCYGLILQDLPADGRPPKPYSTLTQAQIEAVVTFVQDVYQGKTMTLDNCIKYYGSRTRSCDLVR